MEINEKKSIYYAILSYLCILFIASSFIVIVIAIIYCGLTGLNLYQVFESYALTDFTSLTPEIIKASAITQAYGNLISYMIGTVLVVIFLRKFLKEDALKFKEKPIYYILYSIVAGILFLVLSVAVDYLFSLFSESSQNQNNIEMIMVNGGAIPMVIAVVLFAPVVEELIYRKAIFKLFEKTSIVAAYAASVICFTLPHMISSDMSNILIWLVQCVPYAFCGFMLAFIYHKSNYNIYTAIIAHMFNNLLAAVLMFM